MLRIVDEGLGLDERDAAALAQAEQFLHIRFVMFGRRRIDNFHPAQVDADFAGARLNLIRVPQQNGMPDFFFD